MKNKTIMIALASLIVLGGLSVDKTALADTANEQVTTANIIWGHTIGSSKDGTDMKQNSMLIEEQTLNIIGFSTHQYFILAVKLFKREVLEMTVATDGLEQKHIQDLKIQNFTTVM